VGWETRRGRGRYYTRSRTVGGRTRREYVGRGLIGEQAAAADAQQRAERAARRLAQQTDQAAWEAADAPLQQLARLLDLLARAHLVAAGYHRHGAEWRRRRRVYPDADL
jgi:hypothetical protein